MFSCLSEGIDLKCAFDDLRFRLVVRLPVSLYRSLRELVTFSGPLRPLYVTGMKLTIISTDRS